MEHECIININKELYLNPKFRHQIIEAIQYLSQNQELNYWSKQEKGVE